MIEAILAITLSLMPSYQTAKLSWEGAGDSFTVSCTQPGQTWGVTTPSHEIVLKTLLPGPGIYTCRAQAHAEQAVSAWSEPLTFTLAP